MSASHPHEPRARVWAKRVLGVLAIAGVLILAGFLGAAFVPRWWAHRVGGQVNGSIATGIIVGLFYGFLFTGLPLLALFWTFHRRRTWKVWAVGFVAAILLALPNLFTLGIILGGGNAAHAGDRTLDVEAPGFRGACLAGAIIAVLAVMLYEYVRISGRLERRRVRKLEEKVKTQEQQLKEHEAAAKAAAEAAPPPEPTPEPEAPDPAKAPEQPTPG